MSTINLIPDDYLQKRLQKRANYLCVALFSVVMVGVATAALVSDRAYRNTQKVLDRVNANYAEAAKQLEQMRTLEASKRQMMGKAIATGILLERIPRSFLLATLTKALPGNASLLKVELKPGETRTINLAYQIIDKL